MSRFSKLPLLLALASACPPPAWAQTAPATGAAPPEQVMQSRWGGTVPVIQSGEWKDLDLK